MREELWLECEIMLYVLCIVNRDLRLIDHHAHTHLTMTSLCLSAIDPYGLGVIDCDDELEGAWSRA